MGWKVHWLKISYNDIILAVDEFFDKCDQSTATPIKRGV